MRFMRHISVVVSLRLSQGSIVMLRTHLVAALGTENDGKVVMRLLNSSLRARAAVCFMHGAAD